MNAPVRARACAVGVCSSPVHCHEIARCFSAPTAPAAVPRVAFAGPEPLTETIAWRPAAEQLPDAETNVLLFAEHAGTFEGFLDGEDDAGAPLWRDVCADRVEGVTHWSPMPAGPEA